jgi:thiol:disulfide interchange protein DsbG
MSLQASNPNRSRRRLLGVAVAAGLLAGGLPAASSAASAQAAALLAAMDQATSIRQGNGRHRLYVFFDPNCPYCHQLYLKLTPRLARDELQVHWVALGMLSASSLPKAAAILQAPDRLKAFETNEHDYDFAANGQPGGGILPAATIEPQTRRLLQRNLDIYRSQKLFGVPVMVWKQRGGQAQMMVGVPSDQQLHAILAGLA